MSPATDSLDVRLDFRTLRFFIGAAVLASLTVATCNTMVVSHGAIEQWPQWSMNLAYWAGSFTLAFAGLGLALPTFVALRPAGLGWALPPALLMGYFLALGSAGHGSFFPFYDAHQAVLATVEGSETRAALELLKEELRTHMFVMFLTPVSVLAIGSFWYSITVFVRPTLYPRWMGLLNLFIIAAITFTLGEQTFVPEPLKTLFQGLGFHGGLLAYYALSYRFLSRHHHTMTMGSSIVAQQKPGGEGAA